MGGSRWLFSVMTLRKVAASLGFRAKTPSVSSRYEIDMAPSQAMSPTVALSPTMPALSAGLQMLPSVYRRCGHQSSIRH